MPTNDLPGDPTRPNAALSRMVFGIFTIAVAIGATACRPDDPLPTGPRMAPPSAPQAAVVGASVTLLPTLGGTTTGADAINDAGQVVGSSQTAGNATQHAFLWTPGQGMQDLGTLDGTCSLAHDLNAAGRVVGQGLGYAFLWTPGHGMQDLGTLGGTSSSAEGINDAGQVVGFSFTAGNAAEHAFLWTPGQGMQDLGT